MTAFDLPTLGLRARIGLDRLGGVAALAVALLLLGAAAWLALASRPETSADGLRQTLAQRQLQISAPAAAGTGAATAQRPQPQQPLAAFYGVLGEPSATEADVKRLFEAARQSGLSLGQGEYRLQIDSGSQTERYQIRLPVKGDYAAIRHFCEQVLLALPFASLDELNLKRESIADDTLTATLQFSLHLHAGAATAAAAGSRP